MGNIGNNNSSGKFKILRSFLCLDLLNCCQATQNVSNQRSKSLETCWKVRVVCLYLNVLKTGHDLHNLWIFRILVNLLFLHQIFAVSSSNSAVSGHNTKLTVQKLSSTQVSGFCGVSVGCGEFEVEFSEYQIFNSE